MKTQRVSCVRESRVGQVSCNRFRGFTLMELLVAIATTVILISLITPAVMSARASVNLGQCKNNLKQLSLAFHNHAELAGDLTFAELAELAGLPPGGVGDGVVTTGRWLDDTTMECNCEPYAPGRNGQTSVRLVAERVEGDTWIIGEDVYYPTPGAAEAQQEMYDNLLLIGARAAIEAAALVGPDAFEWPALIGLFLEETATPEVILHDGLDGLDPLTDANGELTVQSMDRSLSQHPFLSGVWDSIANEMCLGCGGERLDVPVPLDGVVYTGGDGNDVVLGYGDLSLLTYATVQSASEADKLVRLLERARRAEERGELSTRDAVLENYRDAVEALDYRLITTRDRAVLVGFSGGVHVAARDDI